MKKLQSLRLVAASVLALGVANAFAGSTPDSFNVTADVVANCLVSSTDLVFGNYDPIGVNDSVGSHVDAASAITSTCTLGSSTTVSIDDGGYANATAFTRNMNFNDGSNDYFLGYELYTNAGRTTAWTDVLGVGTGAAVPVDVYGRIPKGQDPLTLKVGSYADVLNVTVSF